MIDYVCRTQKEHILLRMKRFPNDRRRRSSHSFAPPAERNSDFNVQSAIL